MTDDLARIKSRLKELRLSHTAAILDEEVARATKERASYTMLIDRLVERELTRRRERALDRRLKAAGFPELKSLETYNFNFPTKIDARLVRELSTLGFVKAKESVWVAGLPGTGKTHIASALGIRAVEEGHTALYRPLSVITRDLHASIADHTEERRLRFYERIDILIVEDLGFATIPAETLPLVFEVFNRRHEKRSTIVTSNLDGDAAEKSFGNQAMAVAILDRLLHHAHLVTIVGPSFRAENRLSRRRGA